MVAPDFDIEKAVNDVGTFGPFHAWVFGWVLFMFNWASAINVAIVLMNEIPPYVCENPLSLARPSGWSFEDIREYSCPLNEQGKPNCCNQFKRNWTQALSIANYSDYMESVGNETTTPETEACGFGPYIWHFTQMKRSAVTQFSLVCERAVHVANMQTVFMLGFFTACCTFGFLADKFGRKKVGVISVTLAGVFGIIDSFIPNFYAFMFVRYLVGVCISGCGQCLYVIVMEFCNEKLRTIMGAVYFVFYSTGYVLLAYFAYLVRDWRWMHFMISAPCLLGVILFWAIPESPRWLATEKRYSELRKVLEWAARWNGKKDLDFSHLDENTELRENKTLLSEKDDQQVQSEPAVEVKAEPPKMNFFMIFFYPILTIRAMNIFFNWVVNTFVYYGISLLISSFGGDIFMNNAIAGALEAPAYLLCFPLLWWARKKSLAVMLLGAGICGLLYLAVPAGPFQLILAFAGKMCITASFNLVLVVTLELYPTPIRGAAVFISSMVGRIGSITAPYVSNIAQQNKDLKAVPMVIFGGAALIAGFLAFFIPESRGQDLPETLEDILYYPPKKNKDATQPQEVPQGWFYQRWFGANKKYEMGQPVAAGAGADAGGHVDA